MHYTLSYSVSMRVYQSKKMKKLFIFSLLLLLSLSLDAQIRKYSNEFLAIGVGARSLGMSNSTIASVNDVTAAYWNPAGLVKVESDRQLGLMHAEYFAGIAKYDYAALAAKIDATSTIGITYIRFGVDDIPDTSELIDSEGNINYDKVKTFSAADNAIIISYARQSKIPNLSFGGNVKILRRTVGDFGGSWGFGFDLGAQYSTGKWMFGATARDVTTTFNAWSFNLNDRMKEVFTRTGNEIPVSSLELTMPRLILGAARNFHLSESLSLLAEVNTDITTDGKRNVLLKTNLISVDPHLGLELNYKNLIFLRTGLGNIQEETNKNGTKTTTFQPNIGVGINFNNKISIDYALTDIGDQSLALYSNIFSLRINFNRRHTTPVLIQ
jgi:hypothetical protein